LAVPTNQGADLGFENQLWQVADALRSNMDAAEYKHIVLGLIFLKYTSDTFEAQHAKLDADRKSGADPEDPDEHRSVNTFWIPEEAHWSRLEAEAKQPSIFGQESDRAPLLLGSPRDDIFVGSANIPVRV
jgi:type I restriction enzyme M protein